MKHNKGEIRNLKKTIEDKEIELHDLKVRMEGGTQKQSPKQKLLPIDEEIKIWELNKKIIEREIEGFSFLNPDMVFQKDPEWIKAQKELKRFHALRPVNDRLKALAEQKDRCLQRIPGLEDEIKGLKAKLEPGDKDYIG